MRLLFTLILCYGLLPLRAQNTPAIEQELVSKYKKIDYWATFNDSANADINKYDSLEAANKDFRNSLLTHTATLATLNYEFKGLEVLGFTIRTSEDRLLRIYSWDTRTGGTARIYNNIYQYRNENKVYSKTFQKEEGDLGTWYTQIYTLKTENKTYYIGLFQSVFSSKDVQQGVKVFSIEKSKLNDDEQIIQTRTGLQNTLKFDFNFFSVADRPERPVKLIYYEEDEKKLSIPVVLQDGKVTKKFIVYQFNGEHFIKVSE